MEIRMFVVFPNEENQGERDAFETTIEKSGELDLMQPVPPPVPVRKSNALSDSQVKLSRFDEFLRFWYFFSLFLFLTIRFEFSLVRLCFE